mgnify:CR=1 FL=1
MLTLLSTLISFLMGGRIAEELVLKQKTTGAGNDIERATEIARRMICEWGMSEKLGPLAFGHGDDEVFLGRQISNTAKDYSEATAQEIDGVMVALIMHASPLPRRSVEELLSSLHSEKTTTEYLILSSVKKAPLIERVLLDSDLEVQKTGSKHWVWLRVTQKE